MDSSLYWIFLPWTCDFWTDPHICSLFNILSLTSWLQMFLGASVYVERNTFVLLFALLKNLTSFLATSLTLSFPRRQLKAVTLWNTLGHFQLIHHKKNPQNMKKDLLFIPILPSLLWQSCQLVSMTYSICPPMRNITPLLKNDLKTCISE